MNKKFVTQEERDRIINLRTQGLSSREIRAVVGRSLPTVQAVLRQPFRRFHVITEQEKRAIKQLYQERYNSDNPLSQRDLAIMFERSQSTINKIVNSDD